MVVVVDVAAFVVVAVVVSAWWSLVFWLCWGTCWQTTMADALIHLNPLRSNLRQKTSTIVQVQAVMIEIPSSCERSDPSPGTETHHGWWLMAHIDGLVVDELVVLLGKEKWVTGCTDTISIQYFHIIEYQVCIETERQTNWKQTTLVHLIFWKSARKTHESTLHHNNSCSMNDNDMIIDIQYSYAYIQHTNAFAFNIDPVITEQ